VPIWTTGAVGLSHCVQSMGCLSIYALLLAVDL
jgi:hypothetical protein